MKKIFMSVIGLFCLLVVSGCGVNTSQRELPVAQKNTIKNKTIFALGDSLTAGYQLPLEDSYPMQLGEMLINNGYDITVSNGGKSGETSSGLVQTVSWITGDASPGDIAIVTIGGNDGLQSLPIEQLTMNLREIIDILQSKEIEVVIGGMQIPTNFNPQYRKQFAELYPSVAEYYGEKVTLLPFLLEGVAGDPSLNLPDGIHPNKSGYAIIAKTVYNHLLQQGLLND